MSTNFSSTTKTQKEMYEDLMFVTKLERWYPQIDWTAIYSDKGIKGLEKAVDLWKTHFASYINED